ncbi:MAG TPA: DUF1801 domain-containing protein [Allosphingosinicella sp.]|jgi:uncharacterized protein YdhG (YjbR/CyaY superfamily)
MVSSKAATPEAYLAELPPERREVVSRVRDLVNANIPDGYRETVAWGMLCWGIPLERYPDTYNGQPLGYAAVAAQKNHYSLYLNCIYASEERTQRLKEAYAAAGKKLDMGKSCIRFKKVEDLAEDVLAEAIRSVPPDEFIAEYERVRAR